MTRLSTSARLVILLIFCMAASALGLSIANAVSGSSPASVSAPSGHVSGQATPGQQKVRQVTYSISSENQVCHLVRQSGIAAFTSPTTNAPALDDPPVYGCDVSDSIGDGTLLQISVGSPVSNYQSELKSTKHDSSGKKASMTTPVGLDVPGTTMAYTAKYRTGDGFEVHWVKAGSNLEYDLQILDFPSQHPMSPAQIIQAVDQFTPVAFSHN